MNEPEPTRRRWWHSTERNVLLVFALVVALVLVVVGYELNWIHERRALVELGGRASLACMDDVYRDEPGYSLWELPPRGRTAGQLLLALFGEPEVLSVDTVVWWQWDSPKRGPGGEVWLRGRPIEEDEYIQEVRALYPEAVVRLHWCRGAPATSDLP